MELVTRGLFLETACVLAVVVASAAGCSPTSPASASDEARARRETSPGRVAAPPDDSPAEEDDADDDSEGLSLEDADDAARVAAWRTKIIERMVKAGLPADAAARQADVAVEFTRRARRSLAERERARKPPKSDAKPSADLPGKRLRRDVAVMSALPPYPADVEVVAVLRAGTSVAVEETKDASGRRFLRVRAKGETDDSSRGFVPASATE